MPKLAIIGCGSIARCHGAALQVLRDDVELVACCDIDSIKALAWKQEFAPDCEVFTEANSLLQATALDGVILATWPVGRQALIEACVAGGVKHILCEKPLATTAAEARSIFELCHEKDVLVLEGFAFLHHPRFCKLIDLLHERQLGRATTVHAAYSRIDEEQQEPYAPDLSWRRQKAMFGGVPWEYACYCIMAANRLVGDLPMLVSAHGARGRYDTVTQLHGMIDYLHGGISFIQSTKTNSIQDLNLTYDNAVINLHNQVWMPGDDDHLNIEFRGPDDSSKEQIYCAAGDRFAEQLRHFNDCIAGDASPIVPLEQSVVSAYTLDAMVASMIDQQEVELDIPEAIIERYEQSMSCD